MFVLPRTVWVRNSLFIAIEGGLLLCIIDTMHLLGITFILKAGIATDAAIDHIGGNSSASKIEPDHGLTYSG